MAMSENTIKVLTYLQENKGANLTAADVAEKLGLEKKSVDGSFTSGIQRKGLGIREEVEVELEDGSHAKVKVLRLTDAGVAFDPNAVEA